MKMSERIKKNNVKEYDIIRAFLVLLVVIGHCTYYSISTQYGGVDYNGLMLKSSVSNTFFYKIFSLFSAIIYSFHMPMFIALSGALYEYRNKKDFIQTVVSKSKRLLLPFFIVTTFYVVPIKYVSRYWENSVNIIKDIFVGQYLIQGNTHLWYLVVLFGIFAFFSLVNRIIKPNKKITVLYAFFLLNISVFAYKIPVGLLSGVCKYLFWFYMGMIFERSRVETQKYCSLKNTIICGLIWALLFVLKKLWISQVISLWGLVLSNYLEILVAFFGMIVAYNFCIFISKTKFEKHHIIEVIDKYSLGIYLYSDPLNYLILFIFYKLFSIYAFGSEMLSILLYFSRIIITFFLSLLISFILKKINLKYLS